MAHLLDRRRFLVLTGGAVALAACSDKSADSAVGPRSDAVAEAEERRRKARAPVVDLALTAGVVDVDLGGQVVRTWAYGPAPGAPGLRLPAGGVVRASLANSLPDTTSIHWHGIALRNDMDGVPDLTQAPVPAGGSFVYEFTAPDPGTYFFHPHSGMQLDRGLYSPLVVEDPREPLRYDAEQVVVLDDWIDGMAGTPDEQLKELERTMAGGHHMGMGGHGMHGMPAMQSDLLGGDAGDVGYPTHIMNGRLASNPETFTVPPNGRVRLRIINAGSDTAYRFAVGGHRLTVTHTDGFPVTPVEVDTLLVGMAERYDVIVQPRSGAWPVVAVAEGKQGMGAAVLRTSDASATPAPPPETRPAELDGRLLEYTDLRAAPAVDLGPGKADRTHRVELSLDDDAYRWRINGMLHMMDGHGAVLPVEEGERVELQYRNSTPMWHPIHLHGHTFQRLGGGPRKDTINVLPGKTIGVVFEADNPGQWMLHCHNTYHLLAGMGAVVSYGS